MGSIVVDRGFTEQERERVAQLYWQAFGRKLRPAFADSVTAMTVIQSGLRRTQMFVARNDGVVAGVCGFYEESSGVVDMSWSHLRRTLTRRAALRAMAVSAVLSRSPKRGTVILDGICVDAALRGQGVGTALLDHVAAYARSVGAQAVGLSVIDTNPRAKSLYERCGFRAVSSGSLGPLGYVYGFDGYTTMECELTR